MIIQFAMKAGTKPKPQCQTSTLGEHLDLKPELKLHLAHGPSRIGLKSKIYMSSWLSKPGSEVSCCLPRGSSVFPKPQTSLPIRGLPWPGIPTGPELFPGPSPFTLSQFPVFPHSHISACSFSSDTARKQDTSSSCRAHGQRALGLILAVQGALVIITPK